MVSASRSDSEVRQRSAGQLSTPTTSTQVTGADDLDDYNSDCDSIFSKAGASGSTTPHTEYDSDAEDVPPAVAPPESLFEQLRRLTAAGLVGVTSRNEGNGFRPTRYSRIDHGTYPPDSNSQS